MFDIPWNEAKCFWHNLPLLINSPIYLTINLYHSNNNKVNFESLPLHILISDLNAGILNRKSNPWLRRLQLFASRWSMTNKATSPLLLFFSFIPQRINRTRDSGLDGHGSSFFRGSGETNRIITILIRKVPDTENTIVLSIGHNVYMRSLDSLLSIFQSESLNP